jgi:hypothetical protein
MLLFTRAVPWLLKACTVCAVVSRSMSVGGAAGRHEQVLAPVAFVTIASVLPSTVCGVVNRAATTAYIVQSVLFLLGLHAATLALERWELPQHTVALTQTCLVHMLWSQWHSLHKHKHVLIYQEAVQTLQVVLALLAWFTCVLMLPHVAVDLVALGGLMFAGEVLGVAVSLVAGMLGAFCDTAEAFFAD